MKRRLMGTGYTCLKMRASYILQILSSDTYELSIVYLDYILSIKIEFITYNISKKISRRNRSYDLICICIRKRKENLNRTYI